MRDSQSPPVVFLAFANEQDGHTRYLHKLGEECRRLRETLQQAQRDGLCQLVDEPYATTERILKVFQSDKYRSGVAIFHFGGHANGYQLLFETAEGLPAPGDAASLAHFLAQQRAPRLVFLNGCSTQDQAQGLLDAGVSVVIATSQAIDDGVATDFAVLFYQGLIGGAKVRTAFEEAGAGVQFKRGSARGGGTRHLYRPDARDDDLADRVPWVIYPPGDAPGAEDWNLAELGKILQPRKLFEPETVHIPAGPFWMGSEPGEGGPVHETPRHQVTLPAYWMGKYPVTNEQYAEFASREPERRPDPIAGWAYIQPPKDALDHPVVGVSWHDARAYCDWLSEETGRKYRLPTEAEWEKAARGDKDCRVYPWGDEFSADRCNGDGSRTTPVDRYDKGQSPYGCYDLVGNVREWTSTLWGSDWREPQFTYPYRRDKREPDQQRGGRRTQQIVSGAFQICRGGAYDDPMDKLRCSARSYCPANASDRNLGFRVVREP